MSKFRAGKLYVRRMKQTDTGINADIQNQIDYFNSIKFKMYAICMHTKPQVFDVFYSKRVAKQMISAAMSDV